MKKEKNTNKRKTKKIEPKLNSHNIPDAIIRLLPRNYAKPVPFIQCENVIACVFFSMMEMNRVVLHSEFRMRLCDDVRSF